MKSALRALFGLFLVATPVSGVSAEQEGENPRLILVLSIDQMRFDYLTRFDDLFTGGLRTLLDRGAIMTDAKYRHASTETATFTTYEASALNHRSNLNLLRFALKQPTCQPSDRENRTFTT